MLSAGAARAGCGQPPELPLVEQRDLMAFLAQALDFHQLESGVAARGLQRIRPAAHDDRRPRRRAAVDDRAGAPGGAYRLAAARAQDAGEGEVYAFKRPEHARSKRRGRGLERRDHLVGALVAFPPLADAAVDDLLQMIRARQRANVARGNACARVAL